MNFSSAVWLSVFLCLTISPCIAQEQLSDSIAIKYCVDPTWAPYESIENGEHIGLSKEYISLLERHSQLQFELIPTKNWRETLTFAKQGKCPLLPMLNKSPEREQYLVFSDVLFRAPNALYGHYNQPIVGNLSSISTQTVAVVSGYRMHQYLLKSFPKMNVIAVENESEGLEKVEAREIDYFVGSFYAANKIIQDNSHRNLRIVGIAELEDQLRIGVIHRYASLIPQLNKAIANFSQIEHAAAFGYLKKMNLVTEKDYSVAIKSACIFVVVICILLFGYWRSIKQANKLASTNNALELLHKQLDEQNQQLAELAIRDPLTMLYNRSHLAEVIQQHIKLKGRYGSKACLMMIDIDDFKQVNDRLGHKVGDDILRQFSFLLSESAREVDIVARWGGEEFVMLCPETGVDDAKLLANRFQNALKELKNDSLPQVTCSIGIAALKPTDDADEWFVQADNAMYHAKKQGKNSIFTVSP